MVKYFYFGVSKPRPNHAITRQRHFHRTYFIDLKEKQNGDRVLKITESRKNEGEFIRSTVMIFQEDFEKFFTALDRVKAEM